MTVDDIAKPLDPELEYFDATASIEALGEAVKTLVKRVETLEAIASTQAAINAQLVENQKSLLMSVAETGTQARPKLVLPERFKH